MTVDGEAVGDEGVAIMLLPPLLLPPMGMSGEALFMPKSTAAPPVGLLPPMESGPEPAPVAAASVQSDEVMVGTVWR